MRDIVPNMTAKSGVTTTIVSIILLLQSNHLKQVSSFVALTPYKSAQLHSSPTLLYGTNRKSRRLQKKQQKQTKGRPQQFYDPQGDDDAAPNLSNMPLAKETTAESKGEDDDDVTKAHSKMSSVQNEDALHPASVTSAAKPEGKERPDVSTVIVDEDTGIERIVQGKAVMDVITRKAVQLYDDPMLRLAQLSPGVPPELRQQYRFDNFYTDLEVPDMVAKFREAATDPETNELPPHPTVTNAALDFVLANRDFLGPNFKKVLGRLKLRHQSLQELDQARSYRALWKHFVTIEDHLSAPFRQMILNSEAVIGPNFGSLDVTSFLNGDLVTRSAHYITLKATVAHWEKKLKDAETIESTPAADSTDPNKKQQSMAQKEMQQLLTQQGESFILKLSTGDPKRFLPDPPIIFRLNEVIRVCSMAQQISSEFVKNPDLFDDIPPELRFLEKALYTKGGTELRRYMIEEFCPEEQITPQALREGLRRLDVQLSNLQIDPYGDFKNVVGKLCEALAVGTDEGERDLYAPYLYNLDANGPGFFQTYTFNHDKNSLVRFLDNAKQIEKGTMGPVEDVMSQISNEFTGMLGIQSKKDIDSVRDPMRPEYVPMDDYRPPKKRASGRPHNLGWLDLLEEDTVQEDVAEKMEADLWKEITD